MWSPLRGGFYWFYDSRAETSFANDPNPYSFNDTSNVFTHPPQPKYETNSCELCGNDSHYGYDCPAWFPLVYEENFFKVKKALEEEKNQPEIIQELLLQLIHDLQLLNEIQPKQIEEKESIISTNTDIFETPPSIVITNSALILPIEDHENSLIMGNGELNIIHENESDEFIKSSVGGPCSNPNGDESLSDEDVQEDNVKIYLNPLFKFDDEYISSDVNPLFDEDEYFTPSDDVELLLHHDLSIPKMSVAFILEGFTDEPPLEDNDDLFDLEPKNDDWKKILYDASNLMSEDKVFDPEIHDQIFSPTYMSLPFTDRHYLFFTYVVQICLPYFTYPMVSPFLISFESEDTIVDPDISAFHFSHQSGTFKSFNVYPNIMIESPMKICSSTCFTPNITMDCPDFEDSRAHGFVHRPLEILSLAC
nr:hypothetical protein [Tanacetum cinerariifolium]